MKKISAIALVLLVCAFILGVGGGVLLASENAVLFSGMTADVGETTFCEIGDPGCGPDNLKLFCEIGDPGCGPSGGP